MKFKYYTAKKTGYRFVKPFLVSLFIIRIFVSAFVSKNLILQLQNKTIKNIDFFKLRYCCKVPEAYLLSFTILYKYQFHHKITWVV